MSLIPNNLKMIKDDVLSQSETVHLSTQFSLCYNKILPFVFVGMLISLSIKLNLWIH